MTNTPDAGPPAAERSPAPTPRCREDSVTRPAAGGVWTADAQAERAVTRAAGGRTLVLAAPGVPPVTLGPYPNPAVLRTLLAAVRRFVAAMIRSSRPPLPAVGPRADGGFAADSELHQMTDDGCPLSPDPTRWADADWRDLPDAEIGGRPPPRLGEATAPAGPGSGPPA